MSPHTIRQCMGRKTYLVVSLVILMACSGGGGGGGGIGDLLAGGGIGGTGITIGAISGFGSVIVNDDEFSTEDATVIVNGEKKGVGDLVVRSWLAPGMVVRLETRYPADGQAVADQIVFTSNLIGPVQSITIIDSKVKILTILGQTVIIDDQTQLNGSHIEIDNVLEVSGWIGVDGQIRASYVRKVDSGTKQMIKGTVTDRNEVQRWFRINQLMVDLPETVGTMPEVGQLVIVHGVLDENDILVASTLEIESELGVEDADDVEIEGIVSEVSLLPAEDYDFKLGTIKIKTDETTEFVGLTRDDIMPGSRLFVQGALSRGVLLADEVRAKDKVDIEGSVATVHLGAQEIRLKGLSPLVARINIATKIFGEESRLSDITEGQHVKILGYSAGGNRVVAAQVKVNKKARSKVKLQGPIGEIKINARIISIFGVEIDVEQISEDGTVIPGDFFDQAAKGDSVNVIGDLNSDLNTVEWKEIELLNFEN